MIAFVLLVLAAPSVVAAPAQQPCWTLATADTRVTIGVADDRPVMLELSDRQGRHEWVPRGLAVPLMARVWVGGQEAKTDWRLEGPLPIRPSPGGRGNAGEVSLAFTNAGPRLALRSIWRARPGRGPIEHWVEIENLSGQPVTLGHRDSLSLLGLAPGAQATVWWVRRGGGNASAQGGTFTEKLTERLDLSLVSNCEDGASPVPWLAVQGGDYGLYVGWEFSGLGRIAAKANAGGGLDLAVGNLPDFRTDIEPGETFLVPPAFVGCYTGDLDEGSYSLHRFVLEKLRPLVPQGCPDPILAYNLYLDAGGTNAREADVLRSARLCHELGFETFMPDAMWFPECGDWRWDPRRFPRDVFPIEQYVHRHGTRMALWCAWTHGGVSGDPGALSVRGPSGHPDWFNGDYPPDWQPGPFYGAQLCLASPEAKAWAIAKTQWLVDHHRLDYLKHDCGPIVNGCSKTTHRHHYGVDVSYWATMGYYEVQEKLRQRFPNLLLEDCSGGGHIKDFGVIRRTHYIVTTDTLSNLPDRQSIYDSTFALPPLVLQGYTYNNVYPVAGDEPGPFLWRSAMMGAWQIDPTRTAEWTDEERESAKRAVAIYKSWVRPILQDAHVYHILPRPDGVNWDGMFYWSPRLNRGTLYVFHPDSSEGREEIRLRGLEAARRYWVWSEDGSVAVGEMAGADLMARGLTVRLPSRYSSDLVYLQAASLGKPANLAPPGVFHVKHGMTRSGPFAVTAELSWQPSANARSYRVRVAQTPDLTPALVDRSVVRPPLAVPGLPPGHRLYWDVEAVSWGGRRRSADGPQAFTTPPLRPVPGVTFVSDMEWVSATAGAGNTVHRDTNYYGKAISIAGKAYPKGLWTHAYDDNTPADLVLDIAGKGFATFAADAGVEDAAGAGSVQFQVLLDGQLRAESPTMRPGAVHRFSVDVAGAKQVTLRVLNGGDGYNCDHSAWGLARFVRVGARDTLEGGGLPHTR